MKTTEKKKELSFPRELGIVVCVFGTLIALVSWMGEQLGTLSSISGMLLGVTLNLLGIALIIYAHTPSGATQKC